MRTRNQTGLSFGAKATSLRPPEPSAAFFVRGLFQLVHDGSMCLTIDAPAERASLSGDRYEDDDVERAGELVHPSDLADWKLNAEVMLRGTCHAPGGAPVTECPSHFAVGAWSKSLVVTGPRVWVDSLLGAVPSDLVAFTSAPIGWSAAFGGPGHAANPVGKGLGTQQLPNVEDARDRVRRKGDRPTPAGFGPINATWPARVAKAGKAYGRAWSKTRAPYFAEDLDPSYFHAAPADQQLEGFLRGDEAVVLHNLNATHAVLRTRLPGVRPRAFVRDVDGNAKEIALRLDTLSVDGDRAEAALVWRGLEPVRDALLEELAFALVVTERLDEPRAPADRYLAELEAFAADPTGAVTASKRALAELDAKIPAGAPATTDAAAAVAKRL
ncbi:MAG TPA: DUF2169 domain-containing protein, partial [Byssovorax sp.]